jgi:hypothetical protein
VSGNPPSRFARWLLPGLGVKAVVIGGGYATGRELAEFFLSKGPWGGLYAILFATLLFSIFCSLTFVAARHFQTFDYRSFFKQLLGPAWPLFELAYLLFVVLILAVYGAAAGAIGNAVFGAWSWNALGYHKKPFCLLNVKGYWNGLIEFIDHSTGSGFMSQQRRAQLLVAMTPEDALELLDEAAAAATQGMVW